MNLLSIVCLAMLITNALDYSIMVYIRKQPKIGISVVKNKISKQINAYVDIHSHQQINRVRGLAMDGIKNSSNNNNRSSQLWPKIPMLFSDSNQGRVIKLQYTTHESINDDKYPNGANISNATDQKQMSIKYEIYGHRITTMNSIQYINSRKSTMPCVYLSPNSTDNPIWNGNNSCVQCRHPHPNTNNSHLQSVEHSLNMCIKDIFKIGKIKQFLSIKQQYRKAITTNPSNVNANGGIMKPISKFAYQILWIIVFGAIIYLCMGILYADNQSVI